LKKIFSVLFFLSMTGSLFSQIDKEFWFVGPEASSNHGDRPVYIRVSTMDDTAHILLRMPANATFSPISATINPNSTTSIQLDVIKGSNTWLDSIENRPPNQVLRKGLLLTSDSYVTAYYEINNGSNPAIFPFKGKNGVGTEFFISGQTDYANQESDGSEAFDIVATQDTTLITITPSIDIVGHPANVPFQIVLNRGESYSARTLIITPGASLAGSHVVSNKPIAITISDDSIITGGWDIIGDQIIPVNLLGKDYIVIKGFAHNNPPNDDDERAYILATQDATDIMMDGNPVPVATINTGQQYDYAIPNSTNTASIKTTKPVYVYHLTGHPGEAGASILPQDSCTGSKKIGFNRSSNSAFALLILTRSGNEGHFILNGNTSTIMAGNFNVVPGTNGNWVYYRQNNLTQTQVPVGANLIENTQGKFHLGILNNVSASSEYGYFSDFSTLYLGSDANICKGDSLVLDGGAYRTSYEWKQLAAGNWVTVGSNRTYAVHDTGYFSCMTNGDFCTLMDTIHIGYTPSETVSLGSDRTICQGDSATFSLTGNYITYLWSNGTIEPEMTTGNQGAVWVRVTNNNNCALRDTVMVFVDSLPLTNHPITGPPAVCQGENNVIFSVDSLHYAVSYAWTLPPGATGASATKEIVLGFSTLALSDTLRVHGINPCGDGPDVVYPIVVNPLPLEAGHVTGPPETCQGQNGVVFSVPPVANATSYLWTLPPGCTIAGGAGTSSITVNLATNAASGTVTVAGHNNCGDGGPGSMPLTVKIIPVPAGAITGNTTPCQGQTGLTYSVPSITGAVAYAWTLPPGATITSGAGTSTITVSFDSTAQSGVISVRGQSADCGDGTPSSLNIVVNPLPSPAGIVSGSNPVCQGQTGVLYSLAAIPNATTYEWTIPAGCTILTGAGTNSITTSFSTSATDGVFSVHGNNATCGDGRSGSLSVTVNPLPLPAGSIAGPSEVCQGQNGVVFTIPPVTNATSCLWTLPPGCTVTGGAGTSSITVNVASNAASGIISVKGHNDCGDGNTSTRPLSVKIIPFPAGSVTGNTTPCQGQSGLIYSVPVIAGADSYIWTLPSGATVTFGAGTSTITVSFDSTAQSGILTVKGHSHDCGDGASSLLSITVNPLPSPAGIISGSNPVCQGQTGVTYTVANILNATSYDWTIPAGCTIVGGTGTSNITTSFSNSANSGLFKVHGHNATCGDGRSSSLPVTVNPLPLAPVNIVGTSPVCQGEPNIPYTVQLIDPLTTSYAWTLVPPNAGTISGTTSVVDIDWDSAFTGNASLVVHGLNGCGSGQVTPAFGIQIHPKPDVNFIACNDLLTTKNARPIILKGGFPLGSGGNYSGTGILQSFPGTFVFDPGNVNIIGSTGGTPYTITYRYTNVYNCFREATGIVKVYSTNAGQPCPGTVTDVRDGKSYQTFLAGSGSSARCWMAENLNYGTYTDGNLLQSDNCLVEKYCAGNLAGNCSISGGYYQWNELMNYSGAGGAQGICMPGWHIPTQQEFTELGNIYLGPALAGGPLKDLLMTNGFHGLLSGLFYLNNAWTFSAGSLTGAMFWSSTAVLPLSGTWSGRAVATGINIFNPSTSRYESSIGNAFPVRCIKD